ncbi:MAG: T9SS type A sorting domain-containing protein [Salibacteraceae bacterium]
MPNNRLFLLLIFCLSFSFTYGQGTYLHLDKTNEAITIDNACRLTSGEHILSCKSLETGSTTHKHLLVTVDGSGQPSTSRISQDFIQYQTRVFALEDGGYLACQTWNTSIIFNEGVVVERFNASGQSLWSKTYDDGANRILMIHAAEEDDSGNIYLLFEIDGWKAASVTKIDGQGNHFWTRGNDLPSVIWPRSIKASMALLPNGNVVYTTAAITSQTSQMNKLISCFDPDGNTVFSRSWGEPNQNEIPQKVLGMANGDIIVVSIVENTETQLLCISGNGLTKWNKTYSASEELHGYTMVHAANNTDIEIYGRLGRHPVLLRVDGNGSVLSAHTMAKRGNIYWSHKAANGTVMLAEFRTEPDEGGTYFRSFTQGQLMDCWFDNPQTIAASNYTESEISNNSRSSTLNVSNYALVWNNTSVIPISGCGPFVSVETPLEEPIASIPFPNPFREALYLENISSNSQLQLLDLNGALVQAVPVPTAGAPIALPELAAGIYFLAVHSPDGSWQHHKIVKL